MRRPMILVVSIAVALSCSRSQPRAATEAPNAATDAPDTATDSPNTPAHEAHPAPEYAAADERNADPERPAAASARVGYTSGAGERPPTSFATWFGERRGDDLDLLLLVVWRGAPGWAKGPGRGGGGVPPHPGRRLPGEPAPATVVLTERPTFGTTRLDVELDPAARTARVAGHDVALGENNVVLVDRVDDRDEGHRIARVLGVDPRMPLRDLRWPDRMEARCSELRMPLPGGRPPPPAACPDDVSERRVPDLAALARRSREIREFIR